MNLTIAILDYCVRLYGGSELSKHLSKCLLQMRKRMNQLLNELVKNESGTLFHAVSNWSFKFENNTIKWVHTACALYSKLYDSLWVWNLRYSVRGGRYGKIISGIFFKSLFTILSQFFVMLVLLFCNLSEHYSQTNVPIVKTKPFKVTKNNNDRYLGQSRRR